MGISEEFEFVRKKPDRTALQNFLKMLINKLPEIKEKVSDEEEIDHLTEVLKEYKEYLENNNLEYAVFACEEIALTLERTGCLYKNLEEALKKILRPPPPRESIERFLNELEKKSPKIKKIFENKNDNYRIEDFERRLEHIKEALENNHLWWATHLCDSIVGNFWGIPYSEEPVEEAIMAMDEKLRDAIGLQFTKKEENKKEIRKGIEPAEEAFGAGLQQMEENLLKTKKIWKDIYEDTENKEMLEKIKLSHKWFETSDSTKIVGIGIAIIFGFYLAFAFNLVLGLIIVIVTGVVGYRIFGTEKLSPEEALKREEKLLADLDRIKKVLPSVDPKTREKLKKTTNKILKRIKKLEKIAKR